MKVAVWVLVMLAVLGIYFMIRPELETKTPVRIPEGKITATQSPAGFQSRLPAETNRTRMKRTNPVTSANTNANREEVDRQIEALAEASAKSDSDSFQLIIAALKDERPEIRKAALDATIQFGSRDAILILKELAAKTEDPREKVEILDAIEFLELPSLSEIRRPRRTNSNPAAVNRPPK